MSTLLRTTVLAAALLGAGSAGAASPAGRAGVMPAFYDGHPLTINFKEMPDAATDALAHNTSVNVIYVSDEPLSTGGAFAAVLDAIQGDGFNPLWREIEIHFNVPAYQITSDTGVEDAAARGDISLQGTGEIYRCSVLGPGPKGEHEARASLHAPTAGWVRGVGQPGAAPPPVASWGALKTAYRR